MLLYLVVPKQSTLLIFPCCNSLLCCSIMPKWFIAAFSALQVFIRIISMLDWSIKRKASRQDDEQFFMFTAIADISGRSTPVTQKERIELKLNEQLYGWFPNLVGTRVVSILNPGGFEMQRAKETLDYSQIFLPNSVPPQDNLLIRFRKRELRK